LADGGWAPASVTSQLALLQALVGADSRIFESLKYHCAAVLLDELDGVAGTPPDEPTLLQFLTLFADVLGEKISYVICCFSL
jgi:hypothetical protein